MTMLKFAQIKGFIDRRPWLRYAAFFAAALAVNGYVLWEPSFADPDSFYHLKMALLLKERGFVADFPWLPFTTLAKAYADQHLLYHWSLVPFIFILGPFIGVKAATAFFSAAALTAFYRLLRTCRAATPLFFAALLGTSATFLFRFDLIKATAPSLLILFLAIAAWHRQKPRSLFLLAWIYVWTHAGWPILIVVAGALSAGEILAGIVFEDPAGKSWRARIFSRPSRALTAKIWAVILGLAAGLVVNPYFPRNLLFYWEQIFQIAVVNFRDRIGVGSEWYPYPFLELFGGAGTVFVMAGICLTAVIYVALRRRPTAAPVPAAAVERQDGAIVFAASILAAVFLLLTLRSRRHVEYFVPFAFLAEALILGLVIRWSDLRSLAKRLWQDRRSAVGWLARFALAYFIIFFVSSMIRGVIGVRRMYVDRGTALNRYQRSAEWLKVQAADGDIVFHSDWDDFPALFLYDDQQRYIIGLDPTFLYRQNPALYDKYVEITTGRMQSGVAETIRRDFGARFVTIEKDHVPMRDAIAADRRAALVYDDDEVWIYQLSGL